MAKQKIGIGLIGLGMAVTPHAKSLKDVTDRAEVVAAYSPSAERRRAFGEKFRLPLTDTAHAIFDDPSIDAVMILTPPASHLELVERAAAAGKHVLLEKPLEINTERGEAIVAACRKAGVKLGLVLQFRHRPASLRLKQLLGEGGIGQIASAGCTLRWWRSQAGYYDHPGRGTLERDGGGVLITQAIHTLDLLLSLAGPVEAVTAFATTTPLHRMETEDTVCGALRFRNGAIGILDTTTAAYPGFEERIEIIGDNATAVMAGAELTVHYHDGSMETAGEAAKTGGGGDPMDFPHDTHRAVLVDFLDAIRDDREPVANGEQLLAVHRVIDALLQSAKEGRAVSL
ncbi:MAG: oxidoreductase [Rhodospirillaceae bacterium]|nr:oxidoreductase [Rhodospirillaceae bacterium]